jgi:hypothetical protein
MLTKVALALLFLLHIGVSAQNHELKAYFNIIDKNFDGVISINEMSNFLLEFTEKTKNSKFETYADAKKMLGEQGNITWTQFNQKYSPHFDVEVEKPQQVHISVTQKEDEMRIMWLTYGPSKSSIVRYGIENLSNEESGVQFTYNFPRPWHTDKFIHKVTLKGLKPGVTYKYQVGDKETNSWGKVFEFKTIGRKFPLSLILFGDMGTILPAGFLVSKAIEEHFNLRPFDLVSHVGDIAYAGFFYF